MQLRRLHAADNQCLTRPSVVTIGNFDGVHRGHQAMIARLCAVAAEQQLQSVVMLFEPQPLEFLRPEHAPPRVSALREKVALLADLGVDVVVVARFNDDFRTLSAHDFAALLKNRLHAKTLVLGDDFHFGKDRQGDSAFLQAAGFEVITLDTVHSDAERISSTRVRQVLQSGDLQAAHQLLGRPYTICGRVLHGDKIGRTLDFPTLNIALHRPTPCLHGIYAVDVRAIGQDLPALVSAQNSKLAGIAGYGAGYLLGAASVGTRPSVTQRPEWRLEVNLPDVAANLYGQLLEVRFLHFLHGERHYPSLDALRDGIQADVQQIRQWRQDHPTIPY